MNWTEEASHPVGSTHSITIFFDETKLTLLLFTFEKIEVAVGGVILVICEIFLVSRFAVFAINFHYFLRIYFFAFLNQFIE